MKKFVLGMSLAALLTSFVNMPGVSAIAYAEEKKLWNPIPIKVQKDGRTFLDYDFGDISETQYKKEKKFYINEKAALFNDDKKTIAWWVSPQSVTVKKSVEGFAEIWYLIDTWLGDKWVKWEKPNGYSFAPDFEVYRPNDIETGSVFNKVSNKTVIPIYNEPVQYGGFRGLVAPQEFDVRGVSISDRKVHYVSLPPGPEEWFEFQFEHREHGFIAINTWLGEKWVRASDLDGELIGKEILLDSSKETIAMQDYPIDYEVDQFFRHPLITPQKVYAIQRTGDYIQIQSWLGDKWIHRSEVIGYADADVDYSYGNVMYKLKSDAKVYKDADLNSESYKASLMGELVDYSKLTLKKSNGEVWYSTKEGNYWLNASDLYIYEKLNGTLQVYDERYLYDEFGRVTKYEIAPQKVRVTGKLGEFYFIETWLGEKMIYKNDLDIVVSDK